MRKTRVLVAAGAVLTLGSTAFGGDTEAPSGFPEPPAFDEVDADGDRMVTKEEFHAFIEQRRAEHRRRHGDRSGFDPFNNADVDQDGILNEEEFEGMMQKMHHFRMKTWERRGADSSE